MNLILLGTSRVIPSDSVLKAVPFANMRGHLRWQPSSTTESGQQTTCLGLAVLK